MPLLQRIAIKKLNLLFYSDNSRVIFPHKKLKLYKYIMHMSLLYLCCSKNVIKKFWLQLAFKMFIVAQSNSLHNLSSLSNIKKYLKFHLFKYLHVQHDRFDVKHFWGRSCCLIYC